MSILKKYRISFREGMQDTIEYLSDVYASARQTFTKASPYYHIITILNEIKELVFYYVEDSVTELNINTAKREGSIAGLARLAGHDSYRGTAASGEAIVYIKSEKSASILGNRIRLPKYAKLREGVTGIEYTIKSDSAYTDIHKGSPIPLILRQGTYDTQTFISDGRPLQSFNLQGRRGLFIDESEIYVSVNGSPCRKYGSLYDMNPNEYGCLVKTGIAGGIDLYFGNGNFGQIPPLGAYIDVEYLEHSGFSGNIDPSTQKPQWQWIDSAIDDSVNPIDANEFIGIRIENPIVMGSNPESKEFTKTIAPLASQTFVLANADNYRYYLERMGIFSYIEAFSTTDDEYLYDDNIVYLFLIPSVKYKTLSGAGYYGLSESDFILDSYEKKKLITTIDASKRQVVSTEAFVLDPIVKRFAINAYIKSRPNTDRNAIQSKATTLVSGYLSSFSRRDYMPKSDLIAILEDVTEIDSVNIQFISEENEKAHIDGFYIKSKYIGGSIVEERIAITDMDSIGIDSFGDIQISKFDIPIFLGGFYDRFGQYYASGIQVTGLCALNITIA